MMFAKSGMLHVGLKDVFGHFTQDICIKRTIVISRAVSGDGLNKPLSGEKFARPSGIATMMRLPHYKSVKNLDACFVGVPMDHGTSNRSGTRFGPRQIRTESVVVHEVNVATGASPFTSLQVADIGDVEIKLYDLVSACESIRNSYSKIVKDGCVPISAGGDGTITYPILQAIAEKHGPVGLVHVDARGDCADLMLGEKIAHGTPFRRAVEDGLLDCDRVVQIGLRGSGCSLDDYKFQRDQGFLVVTSDECWHKPLTPLMMEKVVPRMGNGPVYISFDIAALDPAYAQGTGAPEIGGLTSIQGIEIIRACAGLNIIGADMVEVCPPFDTAGTTALIAANLMFEMLCVLPGVQRNKSST